MRLAEIISIPDIQIKCTSFLYLIDRNTTAYKSFPTYCQFNYIMLTHMHAVIMIYINISQA